MNLNLEGKVAIVTGAARGIGRAIALTLSREGANVVIDDIDLEAAKLVEEEAKGLGVQAIAIEADVTKLEEVRQMVKETLSKFGGIDILVNNAGILYIKGQAYLPKLFEQYTEDDWPELINITLFGALNCTKTVLETMLSQKSGSIVNISSVAATAPQGPGNAVYAAGKGGVIALTKNLAYQLGPSGIRVNCISPGTIKTARAEQIESGVDTRPEAIKFWEHAKASIKHNPLGRIGTPQEVANLVVFLASDACNYVTGQTLSVNGGLFMA